MSAWWGFEFVVCWVCGLLGCLLTAVGFLDFGHCFGFGFVWV